MALTSEKLQFRRMGFGLNSSREVLRMQHSGNFMLHNDAFTPHLVRIEFGSNRRSVARGIKLCKSTCKRSEIQSSIPEEKAFLRVGVASPDFSVPTLSHSGFLPHAYLSSGNFVVRKLGITLNNEENTAVEMFRKCHGSQQNAYGQCLWRFELANG